MNPKKRLIIDGQIFQTAAKDRGMGRYSSFLVETLVKQQQHYDEVEIVLSNNLPVTQSSHQELETLFSGATLTSLDLWTTEKRKIEDAVSHNQAQLNDHIEALSMEGCEIDYIIASLFQEPTASVFPANVKKFLIAYDLIPFLYHRRYKPLMNYDNYLKRLRYIFEADRIFTISQTVADDLSVYLGISQKKLVIIDGAAIRSGKPPAKPSLALPDKFILMPTSDDPRKNNLQAVLGFEEFNNRSKDDSYKLVITSKINKREKSFLELFSKDILFTDNLPGEQLEWLYANCEAVLFVPEYEGLGLPVLEAVEFAKKVVCSSIEVFREIDEDAFHYCDHDNPSSIADALESAVNTAYRNDLYQKISEHYTWDKTVKRLIDGVKNYQSTPTAVAKPRLAILAPSISAESEIARFVSESHCSMSEHFEIDYFVDDYPNKATARADSLKFLAPVFSAQAFGAKAYAEYDAVIYHLGNQGGQTETIKNASYLPGYVILHGTNLKEDYRLMAESGQITTGRLDLEQSIDKATSQKDTGYLSTIVNNQLGVMVRSEQSKSRVESLAEVPLDISKALPATSMPKLTATRNSNIIGLVGISDSVADMEFLEALASSPKFKDCLFWALSFEQRSEDFKDRFSDQERLSIKDHLTDFEFRTSLDKLNIFVDYAMDNDNEASLLSVEAMGRGIAIVAANKGWVADLPDKLAIKVDETDQFFDLLEQLSQDLELVRVTGEQARSYATKNFSFDEHAFAVDKLIKQELPYESPNHKISIALKAGKIKSARQYLKFIEGNV